jgi:hypothetical protein
MASRISGFGDIHQGGHEGGLAVYWITYFLTEIQQLAPESGIERKTGGRPMG